MLGAIVGDIVGSPFEFDRGGKTTEFELFSARSNYTDDTIMTLAVGRALMDAAGDESRADAALVTRMRSFARQFPCPVGGYGARFRWWLTSDNPEPYGSFGNGAAMRVSSAGWLFDSLEETEHWAGITARVTHNHPEGVKGAQATAAAIFRARTEGPGAAAKARLKSYIAERFGYDLSRTLDEIRPGYRHDESCQGTVPEAITAYLESDGFENAIRLAVSLGGDSDTLTAITGSIAQAAYGIPQNIGDQALSRLPAELRQVLDEFNTLVAGRDSNLFDS
ncbi:MAG: ADP-ribosylglycohydrolase family protein [Propionibacteriaceae bacterium]|jgi:ADP-ribosylglycohydrolase|nr:ADP-ribosylglycohydrolase family protein [Propionibacteriaceae bacterium]